MINIYNPDINNYKGSALNAIEEGWISNHGKYIELANNKLKEITKSKYSILMANGTCTTHCLFLSLKFKYPNINKIYVPNNCYVAAWNAALMEYNMNQLEVMKMDINTWNTSTDKNYIMSLDKNCAVLIVHNLGNIVNVPNLKKIRPDLIFIEDNCEGMFGKYENIYSGMSDSSLCSSCSFYGNKIITTGEGGAFFTQDEELYNYINSIYSQGMSKTRYLHNLHAYNYRMTNVQAGFLFDQLNNIDNILENKYKIFENYDQLLKELVELDKVQLMKLEENTKNAPWIYALRINNNNKTIDETTKFFKDNNIDIRPFFYPINIHTHLENIKNEDNISYLLNTDIIMIPSSPNITYEEQKIVVDTIYKFVWFSNNIKLIEVNEENKNEIYNNFLSNIDNLNFRYFNKRNIDCLDNHLITIVLYDLVKNKYLGYVHIDNENKYWLGIYIINEYQNKKLGSLLLKYILQNEKVYKINEINLTVDINNLSAIKLYKKNNFKIIEQKDTYYTMKKLN
jgi:perosamine synthetase